MTGNQLNKTWNVSDGFGLIEGKHVHGISTSVTFGSWVCKYMSVLGFSLSWRLR